MENFPELLNWLTTGGAVVVVSWFVSWLLEDYAWWNSLKSQYKKILMLVAALGIGSVAQYLQLNADALAVIQPYLTTSILVMTAWVATQLAHKADS